MRRLEDMLMASPLEAVVVGSRTRSLQLLRAIADDLPGVKVRHALGRERVDFTNGSHLSVVGHGDLRGYRPDLVVIVGPPDLQRISEARAALAPGGLVVIP